MDANLVFPTPDGPVNNNEIHLFSLYPNFILFVIFINSVIAVFCPIIFFLNSFSISLIIFLLSFNISYIGMVVLLFIIVAISWIVTSLFIILLFSVS